MALTNCRALYFSTKRAGIEQTPGCLLTTRRTGAASAYCQLEIVAAGLFAIAAIPSTSYARTGSVAAVDACVKAFREAYLPNHPVRQVRKRITTSSPVEAYWRPRTYTVALSAHAADSGDLIAQVRCVATNTGVVVMLDTPPTAEHRARDFVVSLR
jgi:hypothetical protein